MNPFNPLLKRINDKLDLPQPAKSRIVLEIAADLDDLYRIYRDQGLSEEEALRKAQEKFDIDDEALSELVQIHQSSFRRMMDKITEQGQTRWERIVLIIAVLLIVIISTRVIFTTPFFLEASKFVWPLLGIAFCVFILFFIKFYNIYIKKDHKLKRLRRGLSLLLFLAGCSLAVGVFGYYMELFLAKEGDSVLGAYFMMTTVVPDSEKTLVDLTNWFIRSSSLVMVSMIVTIIAALIWFVLMNKVNKIEQAEAAFLLEE